LPDEDKKALAEKLKKEIAKLEFEEKILRKRDDRLKWEQEMLQMEEGQRAKGDQAYDKQQQEPSATPPGAPEPTPAPMKEEDALDPGTTYLLLEEVPNRAVNLYLRELKGGMRGLYVTRSNPVHVKKKFDLGDSKICWLTGVRAGGDVVSISGLQELSIMVSNTIDESPNSVIFLDGVEYLVSNNDFPIVLRLIQQIRDKVSTSESKLIIPLNPNALESRQLTLLERECHTLK
jgi:hypothetical protein